MMFMQVFETKSMQKKDVKSPWTGEVEVVA